MFRRSNQFYQKTFWLCEYRFISYVLYVRTREEIREHNAFPVGQFGRIAVYSVRPFNAIGHHCCHNERSHPGLQYDNKYNIISRSNNNKEIGGK